eukprot:scaffold1348_cov142-Skeletonema_marinoi.AAC.10
MEPVLQPPLERVALRSRLILHSSQLELEVEETPVHSSSSSKTRLPPRGGGSEQSRLMHELIPVRELILYSSLDG